MKRLLTLAACLFLAVPLYGQEPVKPEFIGNTTSQVGGTTATTIMTETDQVANSRRWAEVVNAGIKKYQITTDNGVTTFDWMTVTRSGSTSANVEIPRLFSPASGYHNWGSTYGSGGYGIRDNAGTLEWKNTAGSWQPFAANAASQGGGWTHSTGLVSLDTGTDRVQAGNVNRTRYADVFNGANAGAKITTAIGDTPSTGGYVNGIGLEDTQAWTADPFTGVTKSITVELGVGTTTISANTTVPRNVTLKLNEGTILSVNGGSTLTINGRLDAPSLTQHFAGAGTIAISPNSTPTVYPQWFGAISDDATDDTSAIQKTFDSAISGSVVTFTNGTYIVSNVTIDHPLTVRGENRGLWNITTTGALLQAKAAATGYLLTIAANTELDTDGYLGGVVVTGLGFDGLARGSSIGAIKMQTLEHFLLSNLRIENFQREALNFYTNVREGSVEDIWTRWNADADNGYPDINLFDTQTSTADAHNFIYFNRVSSGLSMGDHVLVDTVALKELNGSPVTVRDIFFDDFTTHGIMDSLDGVLYSYTAAQKASGRVVVKSSDNIHFTNTTMKIAGIGMPFIHILNGSHANGPTKITLNNVDTAGRYAYTGNQVGVKIDNGDVHITNSNIDGPLKSIEAAANTFVYVDTATSLYTGSSTLDVADNARGIVVLPADLTVTKALRLVDSLQDDPVFQLSNTKAGGHDYKIISGSGASGNGAGALYIYDATDGRRVAQFDSSGKFIVDRAISTGVVTLTYSGTIATNANLGNYFQITVTNNSNFTISNPTNLTAGQRITYEIINTSGGAMGTITWGAAFSLGTGVYANPANGKRRLVTFVYNGGQINLENAGTDL